MSNLLSGELVSGAARRPVWSRPADSVPFAAWSAENFAVERLDDPAPPAPPLDPEAVAAHAFAEGYDQGQRELLEAIAQEREALGTLASALEVLRPEPTGALAALLAETVDRLVRQIVGTIEIDADVLVQRCAAAAELIGEETRPATLRLNPADAERLATASLPVPMIADEHVAPGTLLLETAQGWIEDGPAVRLDRLRTALDRMGPQQWTRQP